MADFADSQAVTNAVAAKLSPKSYSGWYILMLDSDLDQYCLVRVPDRSKSTIQETTRDIFIQWIGPKVSVIKRGKKASHLGRVQEVLQHYHAAISATNKANFNENNVMNKSMPLSGSHVID